MAPATTKQVASNEAASPTHASWVTRLWRGTKTVSWVLVNHLRRTGVGLVCAVGYFDPYAATGGASHYTTPAPLNTQAAAGHPMRSPTHTSSVGMPQAHGRDPSYSDSPPVYDAATAHPPGMWSAKPSGR